MISRYNLIYVIVYTGLVSILLAVFIFCAAVVSDNFWMLRAFDPDEAGVIGDIHRMYVQNRWQPFNYIYGTCHTYLSLLCLNLLGLFKTITFTDVAVVGRLVNVLALCLIPSCLAFCHKESRRNGLILVMALLLFSNPLMLKYVLNAKPENLQALFVFASATLFTCSLEKMSLKGLFAAGVLAGLAFTTKYAGAILLVFLSAFAVLQQISTRVWGKPQNDRRNGFRLLVMLGGGFIAGACLSSPFMIRDIADVYEVLRAQSKTMSSGYVLADDKPWYAWLELITSPQVYGWAGLGWFGLGSLFLCKATRGKSDSTMIFPVVWVVFYMVYLSALVNEQPPRYLLIIVPFLCYVTAYAFIWACSRLSSRSGRLIVGLLFMFSFIPQMLCSYQFVVDLLGREKSGKIHAGRWIEMNVPKESAVVSDLYSYVPPYSKRAYRLDYLQPVHLIKAKASYVVVSRQLMDRFENVADRLSYREGEDTFMKHYALYNGLKNGTLMSFKLKKDFGEVLVYAREQ